jgi:hypothetical protein
LIQFLSYKFGFARPREKNGAGGYFSRNFLGGTGLTTDCSEALVAALQVKEEAALRLREELVALPTDHSPAWWILPVGSCQYPRRDSNPRPAA